MNKQHIIKMAQEELKYEETRAAVEECKKKLKARKWYHRIFPWKIIIIRRSV